MEQRQTDIQERISLLRQRGKLPNHVAIIMDGNGRWAKKRGLPRTEGHKKGIETVRKVVEAAGDLKIHALTLYTFSAENWKRPASEVSALMTLLLQTINNEVNELNKKNVRLMTIGEFESLPKAQKMAFSNAINRLKKNDGLILNLALSYGSRNEILNAVRRIAEKVEQRELSSKDIDEELFSSHLQTHSIGDPDLLIRTSGEMRISNFLLWQIAYAELYVTPTLWPDFDKHDFLDAIESYLNRERRFGRVSTTQSNT